MTNMINSVNRIYSPKNDSKNKGKHKSLRLKGEFDKILKEKIISYEQPQLKEGNKVDKF